MKGPSQLKIVPKAGSYARSIETVEAIMNATLHVLMRDGYAALTFRSVAEESGIRAGHISYHFPTKAALLNGLLDAVLAAYSERAERLTASLSGGDRLRFKAAIVSVLRDIQTFQTTHLFPELWSMANHDAEISERLHDFYRQARIPTIQMLQRLNPALSDHDAETLCIFLSCCAEGTTIFAGHGKPYSDRMPDIAALAIHSFVELAETITPEQMHFLRAEWSNGALGDVSMPEALLASENSDRSSRMAGARTRK